MMYDIAFYWYVVGINSLKFRQIIFASSKSGQKKTSLSPVNWVIRSDFALQSMHLK